METFKEQQQLDEAIDIKKALKKVKGLSDKQMNFISRLPMPVLTSIVNQLSTVVAHNDLEEAPLVMNDMDMVKTILSKIENDIGNLNIKKQLEKAWPKIQLLAKMAGYKVTKSAQTKGRMFRSDIKK